MVEQRTYCKGRYTQIFTFLIWTWYVWIHRKRRHGWLEKYRPLNMGSQVCKRRATSLGAGTHRRFIIGAYKSQGVFTEVFFFWFWIHTASAPSTAGMSTGRGAIIRKRLARRHSRHGPWTHERWFEVDVFVCWEWEWLLLLRVCFSFFLGFQRPNLSTRLN